MDTEAVITNFYNVRDIPYRIPLSVGEEDHCCSGKSTLLKEQLEKLGYKVKFRVCSFKWSDMDLPEEVISVPHEDLSSHSYLEVLINGIWIIVDPTWDSGLKSIFTVNEWDGISNTEIAVKPIETFSTEKSSQIMANEDKQSIIADLQANGAFYQAFNDWLQQIRVQF